MAEQVQHKTVIVTDSCGDVPKDLAGRLGIRVLPVHVMYPDGDYLDGVIDPKIIYERFPQQPKTSTPSPAEIHDLFTELLNEGYDQAIFINISEHLSGTVHQIESVAQEYPNLRTFVFDTRNISIGSGIYAIWAAASLKNGATFEEIKDALEGHKVRASLMFYMDTLDYLHQGGRIGTVTYFLTSKLKIRPIICCNEEGIYYTAAKIRASKKAGREKLLEKIREKAGDDDRAFVVIPYGGAPEEADEMEKMVKETCPKARILFKEQITASMAVHTGPGLLGLLFFEDTTGDVLSRL